MKFFCNSRQPEGKIWGYWEAKSLADLESVLKKAKGIEEVEKLAVSKVDSRRIYIWSPKVWGWHN